MNEPNLFTYATSELSQDAFICWLLSWASPKLKDSDKDLHECSTNFIRSLFDKHKKCIPSKIEQVEVRKQDNNIDVLCIINNTYPILIEDKTGTKNHSNQLDRYLEVIKGSFDEKNIIPIYFKTEDQGSYKDVLKNGYQPFLRADFLNILNGYKGVNAILLDYRSYLQSISDKVENYKYTKISKWDRYAWMGFYLELQKRLGDGNWGYVAPKGVGGFLGFWWHFQEDNDCQQHLQLKQDKFCFKIKVKNKDERRLLRSKWHEIIKSQAQDNGLDLVKPSRFGKGEYMTV